MINTFRIYEEFIPTMGDAAARKLAAVLGALYEDLQNTVTKLEFNELREAVRELAEAQQRTEQRIDRLTLRMEELAAAQQRTEQRLGELAAAQQRTEQRVDTLALRMEELAAAQQRTEQRVDTLALRMEELAAAQQRTELAIQRLSERLDDTNRQVGGLAMTVGYTLENQAYRALPALLKRDHGIDLEERLLRDYLIDRKGRAVEINILGRARRGDTPLLIVGESKAQLSRRDIDRFLERRVAQLDGAGRELFPVLVTHMVSARDVMAHARDRGVALYLSYDFD